MKEQHRWSTTIALSELVPYYRHFAPLYTAHAQIKSRITRWKNYFCLRGYITKWKRTSSSTGIVLPKLVPYYRNFTPLYTAHAQLKSRIIPWKRHFCLRRYIAKWKRTCRSIGIHNLHTAHTQMKSWITQWKRHIFLRRCITKWKSKSFSTRIALSELVPYYRHFAPLYTAHA